MKRGEWPCTLSHRLRGSTLGIFGLGAIGQLVAEGGRGLGMEILVWGQKDSLEKARGGRDIACAASKERAVRALGRAVAACAAAPGDPRHRRRRTISRA